MIMLKYVAKHQISDVQVVSNKSSITGKYLNIYIYILIKGKTKDFLSQLPQITVFSY